MSVRFVHSRRNCNDCNRLGPGFLFEDPGVAWAAFVCRSCAAHVVRASVLDAAVVAHKERAMSWMAQVQEPQP